jgi:hypothetical protein
MSPRQGEKRADGATAEAVQGRVRRAPRSEALPGARLLMAMRTPKGSCAETRERFDDAMRSVPSEQRVDHAPRYAAVVAPNEASGDRTTDY